MKDYENSLRYTKEGAKFHGVMERLKELTKQAEEAWNNPYADKLIEDLFYYVHGTKAAFEEGNNEDARKLWREAEVCYQERYKGKESIENNYLSVFSARTKVIELQADIGKRFQFPDFQIDVEAKLQEVESECRARRTQRLERYDEAIRLFEQTQAEEDFPYRFGEE